MPRFRNTSALSAPMNVPVIEHDSAITGNGTQLSCRDETMIDRYMSTNPMDPRDTIPTPSPSPISEPVTPPSSTSTSTSQKRKHSSRASQSSHHIPRPRNAFILFRSYALSAGLVTSTQQNEASREIGRIWKGVDEETRREFEERAAEEKRVHKLRYPGYRYAPKKNGAVNDNVGVEREKLEKAKVKGVERESRRVQPRASARYSPIVRPVRTKKTLPTPESTPELSPSVVPAFLDATIAADDELQYLIEDTEVDAARSISLPDVSAGVFDPVHAPAPQPEFSFPPENEDIFLVDPAYVPCLASSAYYNPTFIHADRRLTRPPAPIPEFTELDELARRALRPSAPLWHHEARRRAGLESSSGLKNPQGFLSTGTTDYHAETVDWTSEAMQAMVLNLFISNSS